MDLLSTLCDEDPSLFHNVLAVSGLAALAALRETSPALKNAVDRSTAWRDPAIQNEMVRVITKKDSHLLHSTPLAETERITKLVLREQSRNTAAGLVTHETPAESFREWLRVAMPAEGVQPFTLSFGGQLAAPGFYEDIDDTARLIQICTAVYQNIRANMMNNRASS